jgi:Tat protein secretion system quality control protein TatD with DNase activity
MRGRELGVKQTRILIEADRPYCSVVEEACGERTRGWRLAEETVQ